MNLEGRRGRRKNRGTTTVLGQGGGRGLSFGPDVTRGVGLACPRGRLRKRKKSYQKGGMVQGKKN